MRWKLLRWQQRPLQAGLGEWGREQRKAPGEPSNADLTPPRWRGHLPWSQVSGTVRSTSRALGTQKVSRDHAAFRAADAPAEGAMLLGTQLNPAVGGPARSASEEAPHSLF